MKKSGKHINRVRDIDTNYTEWLEEHSGYDKVSPENISEGLYSIEPTSPLMADAYEKLEDLYYDGNLKGRQKEIVGLLFEGIINQAEIARRLNMQQYDVAKCLRKIGKKLL